jgi:hypothetical protein
VYSNTQYQKIPGVTPAPPHRRGKERGGKGSEGEGDEQGESREGKGVPPVTKRWQHH